MVIVNILHFSDIDLLAESEELEEAFLEEEEVVNDELGEDRIILSGPLYRLRGTDLLVAEGTYCCYNEETGELEPDFGVSVLYGSSSSPDLNSYLYWEQGTPATMFHNYVTMQQNDKENKDKYSEYWKTYVA